MPKFVFDCDMCKVTSISKKPLKTRIKKEESVRGFFRKRKIILKWQETFCPTCEDWIFIDLVY